MRVSLSAGAAALAIALGAPEPGFRQPRDAEGRFANLDAGGPHGFGDLFRWMVLDRLAGRRRSAPDRVPIPRVAVDGARLARPPGPGEGARLVWIGHAGFLVQLDGISLL